MDNSQSCSTFDITKDIKINPNKNNEKIINLACRLKSKYLDMLYFNMPNCCVCFQKITSISQTGMCCPDALINQKIYLFYYKYYFLKLSK